MKKTIITGRYGQDFILHESSEPIRDQKGKTILSEVPNNYGLLKHKGCVDNIEIYLPADVQDSYTAKNYLRFVIPADDIKKLYNRIMEVEAIKTDESKNTPY